MACARAGAAVSGAAAQWFDQSGRGDPRTAAQLERERYILWHPSTGAYHRWMALLPVFIAQSVVGSFYSTSVFNKWMDSHVWRSPGANAGGFTTCVAFYGLGTVVFGGWVARHGAFPSVSRSLLLSPLGWGLASLAGTSSSLPLLYGGYGVLHGLGCAHAYISTTALLQAWYPSYKGFMSGFAVCGAGVGSFVWTTLARHLMDPAGVYRMEPPRVQATFAAIFAVLLLLALPFLRNPPPGWVAPEYVAGGGAGGGGGVGGTPAPEDATGGGSDLRVGGGGWMDRLLVWASGKGGRKGGVGPGDDSLSADRPYTFLEATRTQEFALTCALIFGSCMAGVVFLSSAADMAQNIFGVDASYAALVTSWLNAVNFVGRFGWGFVTDKLGRKAFWLLSTSAQTVALLAMGPAIRAQAFGPWLACFLTIGSLYGGGFGVLPAYLSDMFGAPISAATHGCMIGVWALACVVGIPLFTSVTARYSAVVGGLRIPLPEAYIVNSQWLSALPAFAFLATLLLNVRREDRVAKRERGEAVRVRVGAHVLTLKLAWLTPAAQRVQYEEDAGGGGGLLLKGGCSSSTVDPAPPSSSTRVVSGEDGGGSAGSDPASVALAVRGEERGGGVAHEKASPLPPGSTLEPTRAVS